jgi:hypothetical protein
MSKKMSLVVFVGFFAGALSWASAGIVSNNFEPFDSGIGFFSSQSILSVVAVAVGYKSGIKMLLIYLAVAYVGINVYAFTFGSDESRAWVLLAAVTTIFLLVIPLIFGLLGRSINLLQNKYGK